MDLVLSWSPASPTRCARKFQWQSGGWNFRVRSRAKRRLEGRSHRPGGRRRREAFDWKLTGAVRPDWTEFARGPLRTPRARRSAREPAPRWTTVQAKGNSAKGLGSRSKARGSRSKAKVLHELGHFKRLGRNPNCFPARLGPRRPRPAAGAVHRRQAPRGHPCLPQASSRRLTASVPLFVHAGLAQSIRIRMSCPAVCSLYVLPSRYFPR
jgi:hypothetical protein